MKLSSSKKIDFQTNSSYSDVATSDAAFVKAHGKHFFLN
jgi:hypothetical protein